MKQRILALLLPFLLIAITGNAQRNDVDPLFSVTIDSPQLIMKGSGKYTVEMNVNITNNSKKTLKFMTPPSYTYQGYHGWKLILSKNYERCRWQDGSFITEYVKEFKVKKGKTHTLRLSCLLDEMIIENDNINGEYNVWLELNCLDKILGSKAESNIISFEI